MDGVDITYDNLINSIIYKSFRFYKDKDDLFQAGYIGLIEAYNNYDSTKDTKFTTYAYPYIYGEMYKLVNYDKNIKINKKTNTLYLKITKVMALLSQKLMHEPSTKEVAEYLEIDEELVIDAITASAALLDIDDRQIGYDDEVIENMALNSEIERLNPEEYEIINNRYKNDLSQQEVANLMGISQVQVSRKEKKILEKLKSKLI
ncbi:MAG: sigma-70 family RNA polymerase sigma factor [Bacilli bacterium]|nr:sigma-70 family RNA polymerase sigma factor [Bacilli bacterium]